MNRLLTMQIPVKYVIIAIFLCLLFSLFYKDASYNKREFLTYALGVAILVKIVFMRGN
ncbi:hypothetical protein [Enterococcus plantarum]|uniref:hypothetical protein n=1 Tax=Enterococcus plantarum TaxID=1077675 RepID=UPI0015E8C474|nr:hypothetical protein [Enterococcus plantarum]